MLIGEVFVELALFRDLQNLGAQVGHGDSPLNRVGAIHGVLVNDIGVAGLELDFCQGLEETPRINLLLANPSVLDHFPIMLGDGNIAHRFPIDPLHIVGAKQVHRFFIACQVESNIRDYYPQGQGFNPDFLVRIFPLSVQKAHNVGVVGI